MLKTIRDQDYGFIRNGVIGVNIQRLWLESANEARFIREFAKTYGHEMLHLVIDRVLRNRKRTEVGEEKVVRKLIGEKWDKEIEKFYT